MITINGDEMDDGVDEPEWEQGSAMNNKLTFADLERVYQELQKDEHSMKKHRCPKCQQPVYVLYPDNPTGICVNCATLTPKTDQDSS